MKSEYSYLWVIPPTCQNNINAHKRIMYLSRNHMSKIEVECCKNYILIVSSKCGFRNILSNKASNDYESNIPGRQQYLCSQTWKLVPCCSSVYGSYLNSYLGWNTIGTTQFHIAAALWRATWALWRSQAISV